MKNVRLFYKKTGNARFISHLDTMRFMTRLLRRAGIPVWYTEGFNPHLYITFALPLSLGMTSEYEIADIRLNDDNYPLDLLCEKLNENSTDDYRFFHAKEPLKKLSDLSFATFLVEFDDGGEYAQKLETFLSGNEINIEKKTKKGDIKTMNIAEDIKNVTVTNDGNTKLIITLPAGNNKNINPDLIIKKFLSDSECYVTVCRTALLDENMQKME